MKQIFRDPFSFIIIGAIAFVLVTVLGKLFEENPAPHLQGIESDYQSAETAKTPPERQEAFNRSLVSLLALEQKYAPTMGNGKLYYVIGDNFFQLQEYPKAILYYNKALNLRPRDKQLISNLQAAQAKLEIKEKHEHAAFHKLLFFHYYLSMPERLQILAALLTISLITASAFLWLKRTWLYYVTLAALGFSSIMLLSLIASYYFSPAEAIVISSSGIYRDAGKQYAKVVDDPLPSGMKVKILSVDSSGKWMKVETAKGVVGFLPFDSLQII